MSQSKVYILVGLVGLAYLSNLWGLAFCAVGLFFDWMDEREKVKLAKADYLLNKE